MNGWFGRVLIAVVALAIVGGVVSGIVHAVRDDDHSAVVRVTGAGGAAATNGDGGTVVVVDRDRGWHGGPFFFFPVLLLVLLAVFVFGRKRRGWGPGGWRSERFEEWHRAAHANGSGGGTPPGEPGAGGPPAGAA